MTDLYKGSQGYQGYQGVRGYQGFTGRQGIASTVAGAQGFQGATGSGAQGAQGHQGFQGLTGGSGSQGAQGATGSGAQGFQGAAGGSGSQGAQGATGSGAQGFQGAAGSNSFVGLTQTAMVGAAGNNATGTVGDMGLAYTTFQAAYDDGARCFIIDYAYAGGGGISLTGDATLTFVGLGAVNTDNVSSLLSNGHALTVIGNGDQFVRINTIYTNGPNPGDGAGVLYAYNVYAYSFYSGGVDSNTPGVGGGAGNSMTLEQCSVGTQIWTSGGNGYLGAEGLNGTHGGDAGSLTLHNCRAANNVNIALYGGNGAAGWATDNFSAATAGGIGGAGGNLQMINCWQLITGTWTINLFGGNGGNGGAGGSSLSGGAAGVGGSGGAVTIRNSHVAAINVTGGVGASGGSDGGAGAGAGSNGGPAGSVEAIHIDVVNSIDASGGSCLDTGATSGNGGAVHLTNSFVGGAVYVQYGSIGAGSAGSLGILTASQSFIQYQTIPDDTNSIVRGSTINNTFITTQN